MPMKLNVGVCRKIGQPNYGSVGATCSVELELPGSLVFDDPDAFRKQVQQAYAACQRAVDDQLGAQQPGEETARDAHCEAPGRQNGGAEAGHQNGNGNGRRTVTDYGK